MNREDYKSLHESLTSNNNGTTIVENVMLIVPSILSIYILAAVRALEAPRTNKSKTKADQSQEQSFSSEFICLILPSILSFTVLTNYLGYILSVQLIMSFLLFVHNHRRDKNILSDMRGADARAYQVMVAYKSDSQHRAYITIFRAITNILSVLCILAVDFHIFPRRFAKTETFGYGVMDLGVGLFVTSNALVAPEARSARTTNIPLKKTALSCLPLLFLGIGRLIITQQVGYQEHVTEYGQHWNFFFSLAVTKFVCTLIMKYITNSTLMYVITAVSLIVYYEFFLYLGLQDWILGDNPRDGFISANREGIASNIGYIALYFGGIALGKVLYKWDRLNALSNLIIIMRLLVIAVALLSITLACENLTGVSRRLANMGYFFWILSFSAIAIVFSLILEFFVFLLKFINVSSNKNQPNTNVTFPPKLFEAINKNGLLFFLLGNVLTGLINIRFQTFQLAPLPSLLLLSLYMLVNCFIVSSLSHKKFNFRI